MNFRAKLEAFYEFNDPDVNFAFLDDDEFLKKLTKINDNNDNDENGELSGIVMEMEYDFVYKFVPYVANNNLYQKLRDIAIKGFKIAITPLHHFFRYHPQYKVWKKLAESLQLSIPSINCYDFDVIAIPFWLDMINDLGYDEILKFGFDYEDTVLFQICLDMKKIEKYNALRETESFPSNNIKYFDHKKEH